jgi:hypothetical protein
METDTFNDRLLDILAAIGQRHDRFEVRDLALSLKRDMSGEVSKMGAILFVLDQNIAHYVRDPSWRHGYLFDEAGMPVTDSPAGVPGYERKARTLELAQAAGDKLLSTQAVADILRSEGDTAQPKSLAVAVGNILNRAGWLRVRRGLYRRPPVQLPGR